METPKELRIKSGYKSYKVAEILGITRASLWNKESHKTKLTVLEGQKLAELYGLPIDTINKVFNI